MEAILRDARRSPEKLAPGHETLVFAVYYAAIVALEDGEVSTLYIFFASSSSSSSSDVHRMT